MKKAAFPAILVLVVAAMIAIFASGNKATPEDEIPMTGINHSSQGQTHIQDGEAHEPYNSDLPSSGPHYQRPAPWGISESEIADETFIHNLEHGGIVIAYRPDLPAAQLDKLKQLIANLPPSKQFNSVKVLLLPRSKNSKPIQMAAWTYTMDLEGFDEPTIRQFYSGHIDKGPELVP